MDNQTLQIQLTALRTGDPAALEAIYEGMKTPLYTVILRITRREALAEEVLQELFLKLYRSPPGETVRNPRAYLFQMARNLAIDCLKAQRPEDTPEAEPPGRDWGDLDVRLDLEAALGALEPVDSQIITLHINGALAFSQVAQVLSMPLGTVLWRYQRALNRLRVMLSGGAR